jgi:hypothetical protein
VLGFNLYRISASTSDTTLLFDHHLFSDQTGDNLPVIDGFRLTVLNSPSGVEFIGWTKVNGDTCTFDWRTKSALKYRDRPPTQVLQETVYTVDNYRITIDTVQPGGLMARWYDYFTGIEQDSLAFALKIEVILFDNLRCK